ncbi:MAG TPA: DUF4231 domain-containing protein [bacterium]|nr:DUF4231 domain-containing protein [bacterium]
MNKQDYEKYYNERYLKEVNWYDKKSINNKRGYYISQYLIIILASLTPIFALTDLKWLTVISSSIIAIMTGLVKFLKLQEHWINYRTICETLRKEPYLLEAEIGDYNKNENKYKKFVERVEYFISKENTLWLTTIEKKDSNKDKER